MASDRQLELLEYTGSIIRHLKECLEAAIELDMAIFKSSRFPVDRIRALVANFSKMHELVHNADVQISRAGERLINEAALRELHAQTKKCAA